MIEKDIMMFKKKTIIKDNVDNKNVFFEVDVIFSGIISFQIGFWKFSIRMEFDGIVFEVI